MSVTGRIKKFLFSGGVAVRRLLLLSALANESEAVSSPSFTSGAGAPTSDMNEPNGSVYLRRDGAAATTVYVRAAGAWVAVVADGSDFGTDGILADLVAASTTDAAITVESNGAATSVKFKAAGTTSTHRTVTFSTAALTGNKTLTMPNADVDLTIVANLSSVANAKGASLVGVEDAATTLAGLTVEAALVELSARVRGIICTFTATASAETANVVTLTLNLVDLAGTAVSRAQRFRVELFKADMTPITAADFTMAMTTGTIVSTTAKPDIIGTTDANGDAVVAITDVGGGYNGTIYVLVTPIQPTGTYQPATPVMTTAAFDVV